MSYSADFGRLTAASAAAPGGRFRIALLGDFSCRASRGEVARGRALAARKPLVVEADTIDDVLARLAPRIVVGMGDEGAVEATVAAMDDFHPDQLVEAVPLLAELSQLRKRLLSRAGFDRAAQEVLGWAGAEQLARPPRRLARGGAMATDHRLTDFARLTGRTPAAEASVDDLVRRLVGPFIVPEKDSRQDALVARVDAALADAMRRILHCPDFQAAEALWRSVDMLARRLETGSRLEIVLYDISAEEVAADLAGSEDLRDTALYGLLVEQPALDAGAGPLSFLTGFYEFELSPPHAELLGRLAQLAGAAGAPAVVAIGPDAVQTPEHEWHPLVRSAWAALRAHPAARYLGAAAPRFLLRMPYGKKTDPIDAFAFEEFTRQSGLSGMLWGNPAALLALLAGQTWLKSGPAMKLGDLAVVGELPVYVYHDPDGDQVALPCTERLFTERVAAQVSDAGVIPVVSLRGRPEVRVAGFGSVVGPLLAGRWNPLAVQPVSPPPAPVIAKPPQRQAAPPPPVEEAPPPPPQPAAPRVPEAAAPPEAPADPGLDLDSLLAAMNQEPTAPPDDGAVEADLDALLASFK